MCNGERSGITPRHTPIFLSEGGNNLDGIAEQN